MPNFINLPPLTEDGDMHVLVETPRGSRAKFAYEPKLETFVLSKSLLTGLTYPHDWGFVPYYFLGRDAAVRLQMLLDNLSSVGTEALARFGLEFKRPSSGVAIVAA
jgi:Inorganic pyrophosphatase